MKLKQKKNKNYPRQKINYNIYVWKFRFTDVAIPPACFD